MPSIAIADRKEKKQERKMKKKIALESPEETIYSVEKIQKPKVAEYDEVGDSAKKKSKKKESKKRKVSDFVDEEDEEKSETSSELGEPVNLKKTKKKKAKTADSDEEGGADGEENPNALTRFRISEPLRQKLKWKGIESLFPIQAMTFDMILDASDLVGRARTGQGKTLAFVLPILESLINGPTKAVRNTGYGRAPSVLVLLPTRELAKQVFEDFDVYGGAMGMSSCCLYGGAPYNSQEFKLKRGVDIVMYGGCFVQLCI